MGVMDLTDVHNSNLTFNQIFTIYDKQFSDIKDYLLGLAGGSIQVNPGEYLDDIISAAQEMDALYSEIESICNAYSEYDDRLDQKLEAFTTERYQMEHVLNSFYKKYFKEATKKLDTVNSLIDAVSVSPVFVEKGGTVSSVNVSWRTMEVPSSVSIQIGETTQTYNSNLWVADSKDISVSVNRDVQVITRFTSSSGTVYTDTTNIEFISAMYYKVAGAGTVDSLSGFTKLLKKDHDMIVNVPNNQYLYLVLPVVHGHKHKVIIDGFYGGFTNLGNVSLSNSNSTSDTFTVYRTSNSNLGDISVSMGVVVI